MEMSMKRLIMCRLVVGLLLLAAQGVVSPVVWAEEIRVAGEYYTEDFILKPLKEPFKSATGISLTGQPVMIPEAFRALMGQSLDAFVNSLPDGELFLELNAAAPEVDQSLIRSTKIAKVPVSVIVAKANPFVRLSKQELKSVFTGKITSWKELGGKDEAIRIIRPWGATVRSALRFQVMDGEKFVADMVPPGNWEGTRKLVSDDVYAISIVPTDLVDDSVKVLESPEIAQFATVLTKGEPSPAVRKFIDYAKGEGSQYLKIFPGRQLK